jgi:hypothetical protein
VFLTYFENFEFSERIYPGCIASAFVISAAAIYYFQIGQVAWRRPMQTASSANHMQTFYISSRINHGLNAHLFTS